MESQHQAPQTGTARIDTAFGRAARTLAARPARVLAVGFLILAGLTAGSPHLRMALSIEDLLLESDPTRVVYNAVRRDFDSDEAVLVLVGGDLEDPAFLERLRALHADFEAEVPGLERAESLANARVTRADDDSLRIEQWVDGEPAEAGARRAWIAEAVANESYRDLIVSRDGQTTAISLMVGRPHMGSGSSSMPESAPAAGDPEVPAPGAALELDAALDGFESDASVAAEIGSLPSPGVDPGGEQGRGSRTLLEADEIAALMATVDGIVARHRAPDFEIAVTGGPAMTQAVGAAVERDMGRFTALSIVGIALLLGLFFGRLAGVALALGVALPTIGATMGAMGWLGLPVSPVTQILPSLLLAVGVAQTVYVLSLFFAAYDGGHGRLDAIESAFREAGVAVAIATTTAIGLGAFAVAPLAMLADLGIAALVGLTTALVSCFLLLPPLLVLVPLRRRAGSPAMRVHLDRGIERLGCDAARRPVRVVAGWGAVLALSLAGALGLEIRNDALSWFPDSHEFVAAADWADEALGGNMPLTIVLDSGAASGLLEPDVMRGLDRFDARARNLEVGDVVAGGTTSLATVVKETHRALAGGGDARYVIPETREVLAQERLLFEMAGPEELDDFVDGEFRRARAAASRS